MKKSEIREFIKGYLVKPKGKNYIAWMWERTIAFFWFGIVTVVGFITQQAFYVVMIYLIGLFVVCSVYFLAKGR